MGIHNFSGRSRRTRTVGITSAAWLNETNRLLPVLLDAKELVVAKKWADGLRCDSFVQWGALESYSKEKVRGYAKDMDKPISFIEDGFIRSVGIGLSGEAGRSVITDSLGFYYDATKPSQLETILNSTWKPGWFQRRRAGKLRSLIASAKVSKYNNGTMETPEELRGPKERKRILLIDQRNGDASIEWGLADTECFRRMAAHAASQDADVVAKIHPDAMMPGKISALSPYLGGMQRLTVISDSVNPYMLFDAVDEVYCVTSGMGFEALIAGKPVTCFGAPYYAGWGATTDMIAIPRRQQTRSVEEILYVAWIMLSRYADPQRNERCSPEHAVRQMVDDRSTLQK